MGYYSKEYSSVSVILLVAVLFLLHFSKSVVDQFGLSFFDEIFRLGVIFDRGCMLQFKQANLLAMDINHSNLEKAFC